ncbi:UDP-glucuronosyltransferase [Aphelenchoides bicaudatus]|nr:UDP-glucuronosyltransferase [Aphelenchoides bicaudatus]
MLRKWILTVLMLVNVVNYQPVFANYNVSDVPGAKTITRTLSFPMRKQNMANVHAWESESAWMVVKYLQKIVTFQHDMADYCADHLKDDTMMQRLREEKFDMAILEYYDPCTLAVVELVGIKKHVVVHTWSISSLAANFLGLPNSNSFVPELGKRFVPGDDFQRTSRKHDGFAFITTHFLLFTERFGEAELVFLNVDETLGKHLSSLLAKNKFTDFARPVSLKFVYIGGIGNTDPKPLDTKFEKICNEAKDGVVYISFGTVAPSFQMPPHIKQMFLEVFAQFPNYTFVWKYEKPEHNIAANYSNVFTYEWFPQLDLLAHPKTKLFISHGGLFSITESVSTNTPMIVIPLLGDHYRNAKLAEYRGFAIHLKKSELTKEILAKAISEMLTNPSYQQKIQEASNLSKERPISPEKRFIKNIELATKHNLHEKFDMYGRNLNTVKYYNIDVFAAVLTAILIALYLFCKLVSLIVRKCHHESGKSKQKTE